MQTTWRCAVLSLLLLVPRAFADDITESAADIKKLSVEELMNVEVTSVSKRPEKLSDTASAIQVITAEDIRRSGATRLPEALRLASNLEVEQVNSRQWAISARGLDTTTANELLVVIDGRSVYTPRVAGVFWDVQDTLMEDIDRIEVISGPGAALWGADAVNGVINITTKSAKETQGFLLEGGGGSELHGFGGMRYGGTLASNVYFRVYGKAFERDRTELALGGDATNDWYSGQGGFRVDWEPTEQNILTFQGDTYSGRFEQSGTNGAIDATGANLLGRWTHTIAADSDFALQVYFDRTFRDTPGTLAEALDTYDVDFQHRFPVGDRNDVIWGAGYRLYDDSIRNTPVQAYYPPDTARQLFSGFAQDEIALLKDRLTLTLGTKLEHNDYSGFEVQPSGRLAWKLTERQMIWGAVSRAVRTPAENDREFYSPGVPPFKQVGGTNFDSEKLIAYELGYRIQPTPRLALAIATFFDDYSDIRSVEEANPPAAAPKTVGNGQQGYSFGAELTGDYRITDGWRVRAGYTEIQTHLRPKPGSTDFSDGANEMHDPNHQFSLRTSVDLPWHFELDPEFRYISRISNQDVPSYCEMDVRLGWVPSSHLEISVVGQNLLHDHHAEYGLLSTRQEIQRGVFGKVVWRF
ncbi:MAG TPA: TonB-dependent receptor [Verrucomicrobiae bacterium]|nr:TonB-dependent receptor [Verrucomicrobiae bacterium]